jgi:SnoaL-like domain
MSSNQDSTAIAVARAHVEAWSNHDFDKAKKSLAVDVKVQATTTQPIMKDTNTTGVEAYMTGLKMFAQGVEPGSAKVIAAIGDEHNALLLVTVRASFGPGAPKVTLPAARLYLLDDNKKIKSEQVTFYAAEG